MVRDTACRSVLITVALLLVCSALSSAQSGKRRQQDPRGRTGSPARPTASSECRVALVIGNAACQYTAPWTNPLNDAQDMARVLKDLQFQVILKTNATLDTMADVIFTFGEQLKGGGDSTSPNLVWKWACCCAGCAPLCGKRREASRCRGRMGRLKGNFILTP